MPATPHDSVSPRSRLISTGCGISSLLVGILVLVGWMFQIPVLKTLVPDVVSMKANTALAFVLAGSALVLLAGVPVSAMRARVGQALALLVTLIGGLTLGEFLFGWQLGIDELLFADDPDAVATLIPGRMALSTAGCFVLLGLALAGIGWESRRRFRPAEWLALAVAGVSLFSLVEYAIDQPIIYRFNQYTRMALHTAGTFLLLSAGVLLARPAQGMVGAIRAGRISRWEQGMYAAMALVLLGVLAGGASFYHAQVQHVRRDVEASLNVIAQLKVNEIARWRAEFFADAAELMGSDFLKEGVARWLANPATDAGEKILARFRVLREHNHYYDILLVDGRGQVRLNVSGRASAFHEDTRQALATAYQMRRPVLTDLHLRPGERVPCLDVIAPLFAGDGTTSEPIGAIILQHAAGQSLYPLISSWPTVSPSAETLLVRREGDSLLYLNELRHRPSSPLTLHRPLTEREVPVVRAVLGQEGLFSGKDYRGIKVVSVLKSIPDSPWFLVVKVDEEEALAEWAFRARFAVAVTVALALTAAALLIWEQRKKVRELSETMAALQKSRATQDAAFEIMSLGVLISDARGDGMVMNPAAQRMHGFTSKADMHSRIGEYAADWELRDAAGRRLPFNEWPLPRAIAGDFCRDEEIHLRNDKTGHEWDCCYTAAPVRNAAGDVSLIVLTLLDITERKRAEDELARHRAHLEELVEERTAELSKLSRATEESPAIVVITDKDGTIEYVNPKFTQVTGYAAEEVIGRKPHVLKSGVHPLEFYQSMWQTLLSGQTWRGDICNRRKNGEFYWESANISALRNRDGVITHFIADKEDITARKRAEEALRRSEQEFRSMAECMPQIVWATRPDGWNIFFNQQWVDYTGLTLEESYGQGWIKPFHPDDRQRAWEAWQRATHNSERYSVECRLRRADGAYRWWLIRGAQMRDANGEVLKWFGTCTDIEESKRAEEALRRSEQNLAVTLDSIGDAVLANDTEGRVTRLNPVAEKLTGWTNAEAHGRPVAEVFHIINEETREPAVIPVEKVLATGEVQVLANHTVIISREGTERPIADSAAPIRDKAGHLLGVVLVFRDVTEEKKAERAIRESAERLRLATDAAGIGVFEWNIKSGAVTWDERMFEIFGMPPKPEGRVNYEDWSSRVLPADLAEQESQVERTVANCGRGQREFRIVRASDQAIRYIKAAEMAVAGADGRAVRLVGMNIDITERKRMEQAIRESEMLKRAVLDSMATNIAVVDREGTIIAINEGWERFARENGADPTSPTVGVGANYLEVCARAARDLGGEAEDILNGIRGVLARSQATFSHEYPCHSPTEQRWFNLLVSPLSREAGGAVIGQIDITERKRAELELQEAHETLQRRTADLEAFNQAMVHREQRIIEMKEEVNALCQALGREPAYPPVWKEENS